MMYSDGSLLVNGIVLLCSDDLTINYKKFTTNLPIPPPKLQFMKISTQRIKLLLLRSDDELYLQGNNNNKIAHYPILLSPQTTTQPSERSTT
jgi:hypothetical protein